MVRMVEQEQEQEQEQAVHPRLIHTPTHQHTALTQPPWARTGPPARGALSPGARTTLAVWPGTMGQVTKRRRRTCCWFACLCLLLI